MNLSIGAPRIAAVLLGALTLSGCGIFGGNVDMSMSEEMKQKCPPVGIVAYTGQLTRFVGVAQDAGDVSMRAEVTNLQVTCANTEGDGAVNARISFDVVAERGPASNESGASLQYFVALTADSASKLQKDLYDVSVSYGSDGVGVSREVINAVVPLREGSLPYEEILIGLQLSREELGYNIARGANR